MDALPHIVCVHGAWADGSSWSAVIERLQADGFDVRAPQFPLTSLAADVARLRQVLAVQEGPTIVAGHSYGGQIMTALGDDAPNVVGLVYIAAFGLDEGESIGKLLQQGPPTPALSNLMIDDLGFAWIPEYDFVGHFAADVDPVKAKVMYAVQQPLAASALGEVMGSSRLEVAADLVHGRQRRPGDPPRRRAAVRKADGRGDGRGLDEPRGDGVEPRSRGQPDPDCSGGRSGRGLEAFEAVYELHGLYLRMLTARATTITARLRLIADWASISIFAQRLSGIVSVGLNAAAFVNDT